MGEGEVAAEEETVGKGRGEKCGDGERNIREGEGEGRCTRPKGK